MITTITALRSIIGRVSGSLEIVKENNGLYQYDDTSEAADDGLVTIRPLMTGVGRWIRIKTLYTNEAINRVSIAKPITAVLTEAEVLAGLITSTSAAAVSLTLPTASLLVAAIAGCGVGSTIDLLIDNSQGSSAVTLIVGTGITVTTPAITGGAGLVVSVANKVALFRIYFTSATTANIFRIF